MTAVEDRDAGMSKRDHGDVAAGFFRCTDTERATFEAGIKLGGLFHQFMGTPLSASNLKPLEEAMEKSVAVQPFVEDVRVRIVHDPGIKRSRYDYRTLSGEMLDVRLTVACGGARVRCAMRFVEELNYPLMYVESVEKATN